MAEVQCRATSRFRPAGAAGVQMRRCPASARWPSPAASSSACRWRARQASDFADAMALRLELAAEGRTTIALTADGQLADEGIIELAARLRPRRKRKKR